jgi:hypothetical protein
MALTIDASWRWSFSEAAEGRGNQAYLRFWKNALRWLVADPDDRRVVVSPTRENVLLGDEVRVVLSVRDAGFEPVADEVVTVRVRLPNGQEEPFELVTDATGEATLVWPTTMSGAHRVLAQVGVGVAGQAQSVFAVSAREPEFEEMVPDGMFLRSLVASFGDNATFRGPGNLEPPLVSEDSSRQLIERKETSLATIPWVAVWFGLFASLAWMVRRRGGGV